MVAATVALLAGCSRGAAPAASSSTPTPTQHGPDAFTSWLRGQGTFGSKVLEHETDDKLIELGNIACDGFGQGLTYGREVQALAESVAHPTQVQAAEFVQHAVPNLCPEYLDRLPS